MNELVIYTDGGSRGNPGPAAAGVWIQTLGKKYSKYLGKRTNNEAEYEALIFGLKKVKALVGKKKARETKISCYLDSELVVKQLKHQYKIVEKNIQPLFLAVWNLMLEFGEVMFVHIGREKNTIADKLVNTALNEQEPSNKLFE